MGYQLLHWQTRLASAFQSCSRVEKLGLLDIAFTDLLKLPDYANEWAILAGLYHQNLKFCRGLLAGSRFYFFMIIISGDIIDEEINPIMEKEINTTFPDLAAPCGKYAVLGNHEYAGNNAVKMTKILNTVGVKVLRDESICVARTTTAICVKEISM
jgi:predicted MPP superfamily phosphohydrolase